jgi:hypothetical protein
MLLTQTNEDAWQLLLQAELQEPLCLPRQSMQLPLTVCKQATKHVSYQAQFYQPELSEQCRTDGRDQQPFSWSATATRVDTFIARLSVFVLSPSHIHSTASLEALRAHAGCWIKFARGFDVD